MARVSDLMFEDPKVAELERLRKKARRKKNIIYDCHNAKVDENHRVACREGYQLSNHKDGAFTLLSVLRGTSPSICHSCQDYDGGE